MDQLMLMESTQAPPILYRLMLHWKKDLKKLWNEDAHAEDRTWSKNDENTIAVWNKSLQIVDKNNKDIPLKNNSPDLPNNRHVAVTFQKTWKGPRTGGKIYSRVDRQGICWASAWRWHERWKPIGTQRYYSNICSQTGSWPYKLSAQLLFIMDKTQERSRLVPKISTTPSKKQDRVWTSYSQPILSSLLPCLLSSVTCHQSSRTMSFFSEPEMKTFGMY